MIVIKVFPLLCCYSINKGFVFGKENFCFLALFRVSGYNLMLEKRLSKRIFLIKESILVDNPPADIVYCEYSYLRL